MLRSTMIHGIACLAWASAIIGCDKPIRHSPCTLEGSASKAVTGVLDISYVGWVGALPTVPFVVGVHNAGSVGLELRGCGYADDDWWWLETSFQFPEGNVAPMAFDLTDLGAARPRAFVERCTDGDPSNCLRSWFDGNVGPIEVSGTIDAYDPLQRRFAGNYSIQNVGDSSLDHGTFRVVADLTW